MLSLSAIPSSYLILGTALLVGAAVGCWQGKQYRIVSQLLDLLGAGLIGARLVFVGLWYELYPSIWSMIDIRDGGFNLWGGIAGALLLTGWRLRANRSLRQPLLLSGLAALLTWGGLSLAMQARQPAQLSNHAFAQLSGQVISLPQLAQGQPIVVNLWATWCPPCQREMPVFQAAQQAESGIRFVFVNQGESATDVAQFLNDQQLKLKSVLLDPPGTLAKETGTMAYPTTLFYDAQGQLQATHVGELSAASLANKLQTIRTP